MKELKTIISFKTDILDSDKNNVKTLEIEIDRFQNEFAIIFNGKTHGYGDYKGNLLDLLRTILIAEQPFQYDEIQEQYAEIQEQIHLGIQQMIEKSKKQAGQDS